VFTSALSPYLCTIICGDTAHSALPMLTMRPAVQFDCVFMIWSRDSIVSMSLSWFSHETEVSEVFRNASILKEEEGTLC
jgi:hypothetical protein